ncbi:hypothetical protein AB4Z13_31370 [Rhizobium sp. YAF28]|uniref:hypothetical protein n=1 Tax=Rhizobium sp. YAF28 TaxID=3233081 RepID=UPI003F9491F8
MTSSDLNFWNRAMTSKRTARAAAALVVIGSMHIAFVMLEAACSTPDGGQWLIILIFRWDERIVDVWTGKVRMAEMKLGPVLFDPARIGMHP